MIQDIEKIEYRSGFLEEGLQISNLPLIVFKGSKIPSELHKLVLETNILNCGGAYGNAEVSQPVQYDNLKIYLTDDTVEIIFFNREMTQFATDDDKLKRIHYFMGMIQKIGKKKRSGKGKDK